ncbi:hypothetical protein E3N88_22952 [Mikania micrantha]|uniref:CCHC-type domain-containing protein n=1 Tax=Mikania micrantha TaxID=192012 RepID=A0A5N6NBX3_9ASTR|nr:hypothetical protein E3N88_22950 [Mikania micrantha]KAD4585351.1 hypothetical protein E3N88_22952 [Mikania micrantha]
MATIAGTSGTVKETSNLTLQCPSLTSTNYTTWAIKMEAVMDAQGLWDAVEPPLGSTVDEKKSKLARAFIFQAIPEDILLQVTKKKTASEVWDYLKMRYLGEERVQKTRLHTLKSEFEALRMKDGESIDEYAGKLSGMISRHSSLGETPEDSKLVRKLFDTVPDKFIQLAASMEQYSDVDSMPFEEAIGRLKAYEDRLKSRESSSSTENTLLFSKVDNRSTQKSAGRGAHFGGSYTGGCGRGYSNDRGGRSGSRGCGYGRGRGGRWNNSFQSASGNFNRKPKDKRQEKCYNCDQMGHYAFECKGKKVETHEVNLAEKQDDESTLLLSVCGEEQTGVVLLNEENVTLQQQGIRTNANKDEWYLDNASNHMTGMKEVFAKLDESATGRVRFGDGSNVQIWGRGSSLFDCKNGGQLLVNHIYYIPALSSSIVSLGQLTEVGYSIDMQGESLSVRDERKMLILRVQRSKNRLYKINLKPTRPMCLAAHMSDETWLWHIRMGHIGFQNLEALSSKGLVEGLPPMKHPAQVCEGCVIAKQTRLPFPQEAN